MVSQNIVDIHDSYLVMNQEKGSIIQYQYQMLRKFRLPNMLPIAYYNEENSLLIYYLVSHKDTLRSCLKEKTFMYPLLKKLINNLLTVIEGLHHYLLEENQLVLDPEYIFFDRVDQSYYFMFLPCEDSQKPIKEQVFQLFDLLIQNVNANDYKAVSLIHRLRIAVENNQFNSKEIQLILSQVSQENDRVDVPQNSIVSPKVKKKERWFHKFVLSKDSLYE